MVTAEEERLRRSVWALVFLAVTSGLATFIDAAQGRGGDGQALAGFVIVVGAVVIGVVGT
jgi:hypothetical protein